MKFEKEQQVLQSVVEEAWANPSFKQALIDAPVATIESFTGGKVNLPEGKTLVVFDQSNPDVVCINIPVQPNLEDAELTDADLEVVAGGGRLNQPVSGFRYSNTNDPIIEINPILINRPKQ